jgi:hypothetical protein
MREIQFNRAVYLKQANQEVRIPAPVRFISDLESNGDRLQGFWSTCYQKENKRLSEANFHRLQGCGSNHILLSALLFEQ